MYIVCKYTRLQVGFPILKKLGTFHFPRSISRLDAFEPSIQGANQRAAQKQLSNVRFLCPLAGFFGFAGVGESVIEEITGGHEQKRDQQGSI